jgi:adenylosuccinate lyase
MAERPDPHESYQSVFSWRYGSEAMRDIWSEKHRWRTMREVWVTAARIQHQASLHGDGPVLVTEEELADL